MGSMKTWRRGTARVAGVALAAMIVSASPAARSRCS
jgi:hypothetical protein